MDEKIQTAIESSIQAICNKFSDNPFLYFNEADAIADLIFELKPLMEPMNKDIFGKAGTTGLLHREYPSSCFTGKNKRDKFDLVILNPHYIDVNSKNPETLARPDSICRSKSNKNQGQRNVNVDKPPFFAVVEFKLLYESFGRPKQLNDNMLRLKQLVEEKYCDRAYFVYLQRILKYPKTSFAKIDDFKKKWSKWNETVQIFNRIWCSPECVK